jgi:hypothetical protein
MVGFLRHVGLWARWGAAVCVAALVVLWVGSGVCSLYATRGHDSVWVGHGVVLYDWRYMDFGEFGGFGVRRARPVWGWYWGFSRDVHSVVVPLWAVVVPVAAGTGVLWWPVVRRARWKRRGYCEVCGYDRGGAGRCPECGRA